MLILITLPLELYLLYGESQDAYHLINNWRTSWACLSKIIEESCTIHHQYFMIIYLTLLTSTTVFVKYLFTFVQGKKKKEWFFGFSWSVTILETLLVKTISLRFVRVSLPSENVTLKKKIGLKNLYLRNENVISWWLLKWAVGNLNLKESGINTF